MSLYINLFFTDDHVKIIDPKNNNVVNALMVSISNYNLIILDETLYNNNILY